MSSPRLFRSAGLVSLGTLSSRILGLIREVMMASVFGTGLIGSTFFVAFTIPNLFRRLFGEGALSAAFIPEYVKVRDNQGAGAGWQLFRNTASMVLIVLGGLCVLILLGVGIALQYELPERVEATLQPLRIMLPYMVMICLAALLMGVLNAHRRFVIPAFTPCILNLVWIVTLLAVGFRTEMPLAEKARVMAWSVLLAGGLQLLAQIPALGRLGYRRPARIQPLGPGVRRVLWRMGPAALGAAVTQINVLADRFLALWAGEYGPAALTFSERLIYLPLGLFATALGTILLPEMAGLAHRKDKEGLRRVLDQSLRGLLFLMIPAALGLGVLAAPIVGAVYARGQFDELSILYTSRALMCYAPGLVVFSLVKVLVPVYYAHGDTRTPVKIGILAVAGNLALNVILILTLPDGWKHAGLALGTVVSEFCQLLALGVLLHRNIVVIPLAAALKSAAKHLAACVPMLAGALGVMRLMRPYPLLLQVVCAIIAAGLIYLAAAVLLRCRELREFRHH